MAMLTNSSSGSSATADGISAYASLQQQLKKNDLWRRLSGRSTTSNTTSDSKIRARSGSKEDETRSVATVITTASTSTSTSTSSRGSSSRRRKIFAHDWQASTSASSSNTNSSSVSTSVVGASVTTRSEGAVVCRPSSPLGAMQVRAPHSPLLSHYPSVSSASSSSASATTTTPITNVRGHEVRARRKDNAAAATRKDDGVLPQRRRRAIFGASSGDSSCESLVDASASPTAPQSSFHELFASKRSQQAHRHIRVLSASSSDTIQPYQAPTTIETNRRPRSRSCSDATLSDSSVPPATTTMTTRVLQSCLKGSTTSRSYSSFNSTSSSSILTISSRNNSETQIHVKRTTETEDDEDHAEYHDSQEHVEMLDDEDDRVNHDQYQSSEPTLILPRCTSTSSTSYYSSGGSSNNLSVRFDSHVEVVAFEEEEPHHEDNDDDAIDQYYHYVPELTSSSSVSEKGLLGQQYPPEDHVEKHYDKGGWTDYFTNP